MLKVFIFGGGIICKNLIDLLNQSEGFEIVGLHPRDCDNLVMKDICSAQGVPLYPSADINEDSYIKIVKESECDLIISCNEKQIFKKDLIQSSKVASLNIHGGILPLQRGGGSVFSAFINEQEVGMTVHLLSEGIDDGDIIDQISRPIDENENVRDITKWFHEIGASFYLRCINRMLANKHEVKSQELLAYTYIPAKPYFDELVNWSESSKLIHNKIRGRQGPVYNFSYCDEEKFFILESELMTNIEDYIGSCGQVIGRDDSGVIVKTGDNAIKIKKIRFDGQEEKVPRFKISRTLGLNLSVEVIKLKEEIRDLKALLSKANDQ